MSESSVWKALSRAIRQRYPRADAYRHEDRLSDGVPDVSYCIEDVSGWVELKHLDHLPVDPTRPIRTGLLETQRSWLLRRSKAGCPCFVLVGVGGPPIRTFLLFPAATLADVDSIPEAQLFARGVVRCSNARDLLQRLLW